MADKPVNVPDLFERSISQYDQRVRAIRDDQWDNPTPCTEWSVRDLVNHMVHENLWVPGLLAGKTIDELGGIDAFAGDQLGNDPKAAWDAASQRSVDAVRQDGAMDNTAHLSYGDFPGSFYALQLASDHVIHAWDLARGIGGDEKLDPELVEFFYEAMLPYADSLSESGSFDPPIATPDEADTQTKLLALAGRRR